MLHHCHTRPTATLRHARDGVAVQGTVHSLLCSFLGSLGHVCCMFQEVLDEQALLRLRTLHMSPPAARQLAYELAQLTEEMHVSTAPALARPTSCYAECLGCSAEYCLGVMLLHMPEAVRLNVRAFAGAGMCLWAGVAARDRGLHPLHPHLPAGGRPITQIRCAPPGPAAQRRRAWAPGCP